MTKGKHFSKSEIDAAMDGFKAGESFKDIGLKLGTSALSIRSLVRRQRINGSGSSKLVSTLCFSFDLLILTFLYLNYNFSSILVVFR